jgi:hypothetical protein
MVMALPRIHEIVAHTGELTVVLAKRVNLPVEQEPALSATGNRFAESPQTNWEWRQRIQGELRASLGPRSRHWQTFRDALYGAPRRFSAWVVP